MRLRTRVRNGTGLTGGSVFDMPRERVLVAVFFCVCRFVHLYGNASLQGMSFEVYVFNYNYGEFLGDALRGVSSQTQLPDRVIVSDDVSPNNSMEMLQGIVGAHERVELVRNEQNLGAAGHFKSRLAEVSSTYYMLHSADDFLTDPTFFASAIEILEENPSVVVVFGLCTCVDGEGRVGGAWGGSHKLQGETRRTGDSVWTHFKADYMQRRLAFDNVMPAICCVVRTAVHDRFPPYDLENPHCHDWQNWYLMSHCGDFARIERPVISYRRHDESLSENFERDGKVAALVDQFYDEVMGHPLVGEHEYPVLRQAQLRQRLMHMSLREFACAAPKLLWSTGSRAVVKENFYRRCIRRAIRCQACSHDELIVAAGSQLNRETG